MLENKATQTAGMHLYFPCGLIRGALSTLGIPFAVSADISNLPACYVMKELPEEIGSNVVTLACPSSVERGECHVYLIGTANSFRMCRHKDSLHFVQQTVIGLASLSQDRSGAAQLTGNWQLMGVVCFDNLEIVRYGCENRCTLFSSSAVKWASGSEFVTSGFGNLVELRDLGRNGGAGPMSKFNGNWHFSLCISSK
ncbi:NO signaling/Golgi transport ligand-binding domain-containing protein [Artemisia annua]|uniref:NO signaling/Golgi transport ligand-binding domain-containing protein n=1 Tax=Artemisia annua TaxID=35608 RepID=A0A2U1MJZ4_ARTAN|nr:NO signaling/Golgi transport ligand-binding domain-containing protein [Artemisia annua]